MGEHECDVCADAVAELTAERLLDLLGAAFAGLGIPADDVAAIALSFLADARAGRALRESLPDGLTACYEAEDLPGLAAFELGRAVAVGRSW